MIETGYFKGGNEYVVTSTNPPRPLLNYVWNARILSGINNFGGGVGAYGVRAQSYIDAEGKGRCSVIRDGNRYFYIKDMNTGKTFNPGWYPCKTDVKNYSCTHGLGYSIITSECDGVVATARVFVNNSDPAEIWTITIENKSADAKSLKLFSFAEFQLEGYQRYSDYNSYVYGEKDGNVIMCHNDAMEKPHNWFNGFMATDTEPDGFDTSKRAFLGVYGDVRMPKAVEAGKLSNSYAACEQMVGAFEHAIELGAGEAKTINVLIGCCDTMATAKAFADAIFAEGNIEAEFKALTERKQALAADIFVNTPEEKINNFANYWLKQQVSLCAEVGRDTGKGFRDQLQDAWAVASFDKELAKGKILETLMYEYSDGRCVRGWLPLDHHVYSDGPTWIAPTINAYIKETGDVDFLNEKVKYLDEGEDTVWEHILTAVRFASDDVGEHGLVHSRDGDWNDSLNMTGLKGKGESVWTSIALCYGLQNVAEIAANILHDDAIVAEMKEREARMKEAINREAWDGEWYLAAINDYNEKVGTHTEKEGMIYLNSQTWSILSGVAEGERKEKCMESVEKYLNSDYGPLTLFPTYTKFNNRIGRLTSFVAGIWENGTPYCHGGTFKIVADCLLGRGDKAYEDMMKILPDSATNPTEHSGCEPYALTNMYFGPDNPRRGETLFAWVTGTAGWMFRAITQYMCGFHPSYNGFTLNPCIPADWKEISVRRKFRGDTYLITVKNPDGKQSGASKVTVDGKPADAYVELFGDGKEHTIEIVM
jgi:cellobiose phosphorylase